MFNYDPLPAEWASGNSTMRFLVENCIRKVFSDFFEILISMQSRSRCNLATVTEMTRDRDFNLPFCRRDHFLGQFSTGNRLALFPEGDSHAFGGYSLSNGFLKSNGSEGMHPGRPLHFFDVRHALSCGV